jgi:glycosyltransferase involved in cell wall biosynthesis
MTMSKKVTVIIPTFKTNQSLVAAINSVISQSYKHIEVIVVDDNHPDSAFRKATREMMKDFDRVRFIFHSENKNGSAARNTGFEHSTGDYICFLDDDDVFLEGKIAKQVNYMEMHKDVGASYCLRFSKHTGSPTKYSKSGDIRKDILLLKSDVQTSTLIVRREVYKEISGFNTNFSRHQDLEFVIRLCEKYKIGVIKEHLVRSFDNGVNNVPAGLKLEHLKRQFLTEFNKLIEYFDLQSSGFRKEVFSAHYSAVTISYFKNVDFRNAFRVFKYGLKEFGLVFFMAVFKTLLGKLSVKFINKCCNVMKRKNSEVSV